MNVDKLTAIIDAHWLDRKQNGSIFCTCGEWVWDTVLTDLKEGDEFPPFSRHVAEEVIAAYAVQCRPARDPDATSVGLDWCWTHDSMWILDKKNCEATNE